MTDPSFEREERKTLLTKYRRYIFQRFSRVSLGFADVSANPTQSQSPSYPSPSSRGGAGRRGGRGGLRGRFFDL